MEYSLLDSGLDSGIWALEKVLLASLGGVEEGCHLLRSGLVSVSVGASLVGVVVLVPLLVSEPRAQVRSHFQFCSFCPAWGSR